MTKGELEKESEEKYSEVDREFIACQDEGEVFNIGYILGAEPREKRIAELEMTVGTLRHFSNEQATCIEKLEAQIEKMKCCGNCIHKYCSECKRKNILSDVDYWELAD